MHTIDLRKDRYGETIVVINNLDKLPEIIFSLEANYIYLHSNDELDHCQSNWNKVLEKLNLPTVDEFIPKVYERAGFKTEEDWSKICPTFYGSGNTDDIMKAFYELISNSKSINPDTPVIIKTEAEELILLV